MLTNINIDAIMSDPLLMIAVGLLILGPLVFLVALVKWARSPKKEVPLPHLDEIEDVQLNPPPYAEEIKEEPAANPSVKETPAPLVTDQRIPLPSISGEMQGQIEIVFSQIKTLSKKVAQLESEMETVSRTASAKLETNELKEVPMNPADFTQKLLKLAEHVIILEKDVARLKGEKNSSAMNAASDETVVMTSPPAASGAPKPPIMPI